MKIPFKYGLMITAGVIAWVLIAHTLVPNAQSLVHQLGAPVFFNILHFIMLYLGLKALEREDGAKPPFKHALKTGVLISVVYGLTASLFFVGVLAVVGTKWLASDAELAGAPFSRVAAQAFAALFISAMLLGLLYSTVIAFFLARRQSDE